MGNEPGEGQGGRSDPSLQLYKLEYERAAIRYESIYQAVWQNFSIMSALSGGLLAFGGERFQQNLLICLAITPLLFWFWATYLPLAGYGDQCRKRLEDIEGTLNKNYDVKLSHYSDFYKKSDPESTDKWWHWKIFTGRLGHFVGRDRPGTESKGKWWLEKIRVRTVVVIMFLCLHPVFFWEGWSVVRAWRSGEPMLRTKSPEVKILTVSPEELRKSLASSPASTKPLTPAPSEQTPPAKK